MTNDQSGDRAPVFLVGAERSGTTVLRLMLDHHPRIAFRQEFEFAVDRIPGEGGWPPLEDYCRWLETHRIFQASDFVIDRRLSYPDLIKSFLDQKREKDGKELVGATVHRHFDRLLRIWPEARFIHLVRDPRDVARSCIGMGWAGNVWTGVERWMEAERLWEDLCRTVPRERRIETTYEALIRDTQPTLDRLCRFIGADYDPAMMDYVNKSTYSRPDPRLTEQWRRKLSAREVRLVESRVAGMLTPRGYEASGLPFLKVSRGMERRLRLQDRLARLAFRFRGVGPWLSLVDFTVRKLGLSKWEARLRLKINRLEAAGLK